MCVCVCMRACIILIFVSGCADVRRLHSQSTSLFGRIQTGVCSIFAVLMYTLGRVCLYGQWLGLFDGPDDDKGRVLKIYAKERAHIVSTHTHNSLGIEDSGQKGDWSENNQWEWIGRTYSWVGEPSNVVFIYCVKLYGLP